MSSFLLGSKIGTPFRKPLRVVPRDDSFYCSFVSMFSNSQCNATLYAMQKKSFFLARCNARLPRSTHQSMADRVCLLGSWARLSLCVSGSACIAMSFLRQSPCYFTTLRNIYKENNLIVPIVSSSILPKAITICKSDEQERRSTIILHHNYYSINWFKTMMAEPVS